MGNRFLDAAAQGQNQWWRYLVGVLVVLVSWLVGGSVLAIAWWEASQRLGFSPQSPLMQYVGLNLPFVALGLGLWLAVARVHRRPMATLLRGDRPGVHWRRLFGAMAVWVGLLALAFGIEGLWQPGHLALTVTAPWWLFLPVVLVLTTIQASMEELLFRGYLLQGLGQITQSRWVLLGLPSLLFAALHLGNPEVGASNSRIAIALLYFAMGLFPAWLTLWDEGLELAIGWHVANNLFLALLVRESVSVLDTPALLTRMVAPNRWLDLVIFGLQGIIFLFFVSYFSSQSEN